MLRKGVKGDKDVRKEREQERFQAHLGLRDRGSRVQHEIVKKIIKEFIKYMSNA